jgi:flagellar hook-associated protein 1 FlgK
MGTDLFGISISALNASQIGLATTEHNIANANTPGFSRQQTLLTANPAQLTGSAFLGQGVSVSTVQRVYDQFLSTQLVGEQAQSAQLTNYYTQIQQINNMLADPAAGLTPALQNFFGAVNGVANTPESIPARQTMISNAQSLASSFQSLNQRLSDINSGVNSQIQTSVTSINSYAQQIAALNRNIASAIANSSGSQPNDLLDQRDQLITQLNQEVKTNVVHQGDGSYNVSIGNGQLLVVGGTPYSLQAVPSQTDPSKLEVAAGVAGGTITRLQQNNFQGGNLAGLIAFRSQTLDSAQNSLGLVGMGVAGTFNQQHQLGQDLNGALGGNFFTQPVPVVNPSGANTGTAVIGTSVANYSALTGSDYSLTYGTNGYTMTRLSDNVTMFSNQAALPAAPVDGLTISVASGTLNVGDSFTIRPTVNGALNFGVAASDPAKIAASAPIRSNAALSNNGTGKVSAGTVNSPPPVNANLQQPVSIVFNTPPTTFTVTGVGVPGSPVTAAYTEGANISYNGWTVQITGAPAVGDTFTIGNNPNASADNRNALALAALQSSNTMLGNSTSFQGVYSQLVSQIGNKTRELNVTSTAQDTLVQQIVQTQQAVSGVNLDEEAANLLRYQRAYQAAGKAMQIASTLFDTLLSLGR